MGFDLEGVKCASVVGWRGGGCRGWGCGWTCVVFSGTFAFSGTPPGWGWWGNVVLVAQVLVKGVGAGEWLATFLVDGEHLSGL